MLLVLALTLPLGIASLVGYYVVYGLIAQVAKSLGANVQSMPLWFLIAVKVAAGVLFATAPVMETVMLHRLRTWAKRREAVSRRTQ